MLHKLFVNMLSERSNLLYIQRNIVNVYFFKFNQNYMNYVYTVLFFNRDKHLLLRSRDHCQFVIY